MKKLATIFALALVLAACAKAPVRQAPEGEAARIWREMESAEAAPAPYRLQLSMRFGEEGNTRRVTALLWGNGSDALRLDVMAGVGATIAKIAENGDRFLVFLPRENRAYFHEGPNRPLLKIDVPVPFDLFQLADLLNGRFARVFGAAPDSGAMLKNGDASYVVSGPMAGELELNPSGAPVDWRQKTGGWRLAFAYDEETPRLPKSLRLENINGKRAIILVKEREKVAAPFEAARLELDIPGGAPVLPLEQFKSGK